MNYSHEVETMCPIAQGVAHGAAPIPEEAKWVKAKEIKDISGFTHGVGWCAPQQGTCKLTLNVKEGVIQEALVEVAEVGVEGVDGCDVEPGGKWVAGESNLASGVDYEVFDDDVLQGEVVGAAFEGVGAKHAKVVVGGVVDHAHIGLAVGTYSIAGHGVHHEDYFGLGGDVDA